MSESTVLHDTIFLQLTKLAASVSSIYSHPALENAYLTKFLQECESEAKFQDDVNSEVASAWPEPVVIVRDSLVKLGIRESCKIVQVEPSYYDWPLETRALRVAAPSKDHMCKCVIMENKRWKPGFALQASQNNHRIVCVIVQYTDSIDTSKLADFIRSFQPEETRLSKKNYNFRLVDSQQSEMLTGFKTKGVSNFGSTTKLPIILSERIARNLSPPVLVLGAGHPDWKLILPVSVLINTESCLIADISAK